MSSDNVSVTLGAWRAPHQKTLVASLARAGMLRRVLNYSPYFEIQDPAPDGSLAVMKRFPLYSYLNRTFWRTLSRVPKKVRPDWPATLTGWLIDRFWSRWIPPCNVFHSLMSFHLASLRAAKRLGAITLVDNPGRHAAQWMGAHLEECKRFGLTPSSTPWSVEEVGRIDRAYALCDRIIVPSTVARESFAEMGYAQKTDVVLLGVDADFFVPKPDGPPAPVFRVCYVGRVEAAKGIGYLLEAWKRLALPQAELVLVGEVKPEMKPFLKRYADCNVRLTGVLPPDELAKIYHESSASVFPSPNEGFGMVLLEAMASGLPTIGTDMTGAVDCMENGKDGIIVPARDVDALADAILWCYQHPEERQAMGRAARARIEREFTLEHYNQRIMALYRAVAG